MSGTPETPEGVALELLKIVVRAEGSPVEELSETSKPRRLGNQPVRKYVLDTFSECLTAAQGKRGAGSVDGPTN